MFHILQTKPLEPMTQPRFQDKKKLSIIIVEYKSGGALQHLLKCIPKRKEWEVIVVNNSTTNRGFGLGCNEGAKKAKGEFLLFLNPDIEIDGRGIQRMVSYLQQNERVGAVGPTFYNPDGSVEQSSTEFPTFLKALAGLSFLQKIPFFSNISNDYWLKTWKRNTSRSVDVLSGAAIMMRAKEFRKVGGFDPQFFLYWEEFDLCRRITTELKKKCIYLSESSAIHPKGISMHSLGEKSHYYFKQSRWRFFRKYFGLLPAITLESFLSISEFWQLLFVCFIAFFLRTTQLNNVNLIGDLGRDYLAAIQMIETHTVPLLGIPSSIPRFSQGPINIWFSAMSFLFGGISPFSPPLFAALLTTIGIGVLFLLLAKQYGKQIAMFSTLLLATSPAAVLQSRLPFYLFGVHVFLIFFLKMGFECKKSTYSIFLFVLSWWILFQWELATLPLGILVLFFLFIKNISIKQAIIPSFIATIFGLFPQILYDLSHRCAQLCGLFAWAGYRVAGVFGAFDRTPLSFDQLRQIIFQSFHQLQFLTGGEVIGLVFLSFLCTIGILSQIFKKHRNMLVLASLVGLFVLAVSIVIHGSPSEAYFPPFVVFGVIFVGQAFAVSSPAFKNILGTAVIFLCVWNGYQLLSQSFYTKPLRPQLNAAQFIVQEAQGKEIRLVSFDSPPHSTYLDGMRFLIRTYGGTLGDTGERYIVSLEESAILPNLTHDQHRFSYVRVLVPIKELVR